MKKKNIFLIPARGNSVGVPNKNLYSLEGQTLVQRAIRVSLAAGLGEVIVSSDSEKILDHQQRLENILAEKRRLCTHIDTLKQV